GNNRLDINAITGDTIGSIGVDPNTFLVSNLALGVPQGIQLTGYAKSLVLGQLDGADISMASTSAANHCHLDVSVFFGSPLDECLVSTGGVFDVIRASNILYASFSAKNIGTFDQTNPAGVGQTFNIITTNANAAYGVKTITLAGQFQHSTNIGGST